MRKLLSFTFAILLLLAFAGCDGFWGQSQASARTTITEEEWLATFNSTNYSVTGSARQNNSDGSQVETHTITAKVTGTSCYRYQTKGTGDNKMQKKDYYAIIDNVNYQIVNTESGYVAHQVANGYADEKFGDVFGNNTDPSAIFSCLVYNEEAKHYKGEYKPDDSTTYIIVATFTDGKIASANISCKSGTLEISYSFHSFGTTVVNLPEYTIAQ